MKTAPKLVKQKKLPIPVKPKGTEVSVVSWVTYMNKVDKSGVERTVNQKFFFKEDEGEAFLKSLIAANASLAPSPLEHERGKIYVL